MREHGQLYHDVASTHDRLRHQVDLTTPATPKLNYQMVQTWEPHKLRQQKHQVQQRARRLERQGGRVKNLTLPRRLQRQRERATIALVVTVISVDLDRELRRGCGPHQNDMHGRPHPAQQTHRQARRRRPTGPASTSPRHYEHSAADGTTYA